MNKLLSILLVSALISSPSLHAMVVFGADVNDGTGKPVTWNFDDTSSHSPKRKNENNSLITSPRSLEQNAREDAARENLSGSEDSDSTDLALLSMSEINTILRDSPSPRTQQKEKASKIGHNLLLLDLAPLANVQIINAPHVNTNNTVIKELIRSNLASAAEAVSFDASKCTLVIDYAKTYYHPAELESDNEQESDEEQLSEDDNSTESTTEESQITVLQKLFGIPLDQIKIIGFSPSQAQHVQSIKDKIVLSLASAENAVSFTNDNKAIIDLSRIVSFPLDATQEEINLRKLFNAQDEEIALMKGTAKITGTTAEKQAMRASIIKALQSIVVNNDGTTGIDIDKLQNSTLILAKPAKEKSSLLQAIGLPALKYGSCIGLAYLAFKLSNSH